MFFNAKLSLKQAWSAMIVFAVMVPVSTVIVWYGQRLYDTQLQSAITIKHQDNKLIQFQIESEIARFKTLLRNKSDPLSVLAGKIDSLDAVMQINTLLRLIVEREVAIHEAIILSTEAKVIAIVDPQKGIFGDNPLSAKELRLVATEEGFDNRYGTPEVTIPLMGRNYIGSPKIHDDKFTFTMAVPIGNPVKAILVVKIDVDKLWLTDKYKKGLIGGKNIQHYMLDRRGALLTEIHNSKYRTGDIMTHLGIVRSALINGEWPEDSTYIGAANKAVYGILTTIPSLSWTLISEVSASSITRPIWQSLLNIITVTLVGGIAFILFVLHLAKRTLKPIQATCDAFDQVAKGDLGIKLEHNAIQELDALSSGFNNMTAARQQTDMIQRQLVNELEEKNAELERFTYTVSHDLKSPLVTISGFIGLLEKDIADENKKRIEADFQKISDAANTMQFLLDDLLELSRIGRQGSIRTDVSVKSIVDSVMKMLAAKIESSQAKITLQTELPVIHVEEARFKEIYLNLIENAIKYRRDDVAPEITIGVRNDQNNNEVIFFVKDNGMGIETQYQKKIFGLFNRLSNDNEGTGVGLAIVKRIIEVHNGRIWVESDGLGQGSTFNFVIFQTDSKLAKEGKGYG